MKYLIFTFGLISAQTCIKELCQERTFIALKPDSVQRGLVGEILYRFERKGFKLIGLKFITPTRAQVEQHYEEHFGKQFYEGLVSYMTSGPIVASVWEAKNVITSSRSLLGATDPSKAIPGTIRGDFGVQVGRNLVHASDTPQNAAREINLWFTADEITQWAPDMSPWINDDN